VKGEVQTKYARAAGGHVAYQVLGAGPLDLLHVGYGNLISVDMRDEEPHVRRFEHRLASFSRLIRFDSRGIGLSDPLPPGTLPGVEREVEDLVAVLDAVGSARASLLAVGGSALAGLVAAAEHPERVASLVLIHGYARLKKSEDYPGGVPGVIVDRFLDSVLDVSGTAHDAPVDDVEMFARSLGNDQEYREWWARAARRGASPAAARAFLRASFQEDVRSVLPRIECPVLLLHREPSLFSVAHARYLNDHLRDGRLVELPGGDHMPYGEGSDVVVDEIEEFLTGSRGGAAAERVLTTVLFTDIVGSTERAARSGDRSWHQLLDRHDEMVRTELRRFGGREVKTTGDGMLATFDGPARAMRCALAIGGAARTLGIEVRAGLHTGEVEMRRDDVGGIAVHIAQRVCGHAGAGEVLVSRTVVDLVTGSGTTFVDRGPFELKGIEGAWHLFAVQE
jgi:class 3 adenylate cyclase